MARPIKKGLDYFPMDTDVFSDIKMKILRANYGADGFMLYQYLICEAYKSGYYIKLFKGFESLFSSELGIAPEKLREIIVFMVEYSLFDENMYLNHNILTSKGIQRRYQFAVRARASKRKVEVEREYWLLDEKETEKFIRFAGEHYSECEEEKSAEVKEDGKSEINTIKESKENKRKEKESKTKESKEKVLTEIPCTDGEYQVTESKMQTLSRKYPSLDVSESIHSLVLYMQSNINKRRSVEETEYYIELWLQRDIKGFGSMSKGTVRKSGVSDSADNISPAYDISEYESTSITDFYDFDDSDCSNYSDYQDDLDYLYNSGGFDE